MIDRNIGYAGFRIGIFVVMLSGLLVLLTEPETAAHVISQFTLIIGLIFTMIIVILVRIGRK
jgi:hypothetical protein